MPLIVFVVCALPVIRRPETRIRKSLKRLVDGFECFVGMLPVCVFGKLVGMIRMCEETITLLDLLNGGIWWDTQDRIEIGHAFVTSRRHPRMVRPGHFEWRFQ